MSRKHLTLGRRSCAPRAAVERLESRQLLSASAGGAPNLVVDFAGSGACLSTAVEGQTVVEPVVDVRNIGTAPATGNASISFFVSADQTLDAADMQVHSLSVSLRLAPLHSHTFHTKFTIPAAINPGGYYLLAKVNAGAGISESDTTDNTAASTNRCGVVSKAVTIALGAPVVASVLRVGRPTTVLVPVTNTGTTDAGGKLTIALFVASQPAMDSSATRLTTVVLPFLARHKPGMTRLYKIRFTPDLSRLAHSPIYFMLAEAATGSTLTGPVPDGQIAVGWAGFKVA